MSLIKEFFFNPVASVQKVICTPSRKQMLATLYELHATLLLQQSSHEASRVRNNVNETRINYLAGEAFSTRERKRARRLRNAAIILRRDTNS